MNWQPRIVETAEKTLLGKRIITSLTDDKTSDLWRSFMPLRKTIKAIASPTLYSVQRYPNNYFTEFNAATPFEKWSAVEVSEAGTPPKDLEVLLISAGLYAVFSYKGLNTDSSIYNFIFTQWLPSSGFQLDNRPHFEIMGELYKNNDPLSEEEIFIPIKKL